MNQLTRHIDQYTLHNPCSNLNWLANHYLCLRLCACIEMLVSYAAAAAAAIAAGWIIRFVFRE
jgi:hypothetical protein